ncbi:hypothetical protein [Prochlorococcus sp. MIT 1011]|uniref:hypothetical protein n=1 Tax=Prochlorococcus sp. MIT 1011 TaxID=3082520 RepID=UPI0039B38E91
MDSGINPSIIDPQNTNNEEKDHDSRNIIFKKVLEEHIQEKIEKVVYTTERNDVIRNSQGISIILDAYMGVKSEELLLSKFKNLEAINTATTFCSHIDTNYLLYLKR